MPTVNKILGQVSPDAETLTELYEVPVDTQAVATKLVITNSDAYTTIRVAIIPAEDSLDKKNYIFFGHSIQSNETEIVDLGATLGAGDVVSVYANSNTVSFNLFGSEITADE